MATKNTPAAGASGGPKPLPTTLHAPEWLQLEHVELRVLLNVLRNPLCAQLFLLIASQADFKTGKLSTSYARLIDLCTRPAPERGRRPAAPTLKQIRNALDDLQTYNLIKRDKEANEAHGFLNMRIRKRIKNPAALSHA